MCMLFLFMNIILLFILTCKNLLVKIPLGGGGDLKSHYMGMLVKSL
jgi:hypothetical protein